MKIKYRLIIVTGAVLIVLACIIVRNTSAQRYKNYYIGNIIPAGEGLTAYYYNNPEWKGPPAYSCIEKKAGFKDIGGLRGKGVSEVDFSIGWHGLLSIPISGRYKFSLISDDGSRLFLDGVPIIKNDGIHPAEGVSVRRYIRKGVYPLEVRYFQGDGEVYMDLLWRPPEPLRNLEGVIPSRFLSPVSSGFNRGVAYRLCRDVRRWDLLVRLSIFCLILCILNLRKGFIERFSNFIYLSIKNNFLAFIILLLGFISKSLFLPSVPGIHGDETWSALKALSFLGGREVNLLRGMTGYTGPWFLLQAPIYVLFGYNVLALRILSVFFNTLALLFCYMLVKKIYDKRTALFSIAVLSIWPISFLNSRLNFEITALSLFFTFLSLYLIYTQRIHYLILAGFILGIGTYSHLSFVCVPIALFLLGMLETKGRVLFNRRFYLVLVPIILIYSIKLLDIKYSGLKDIPGDMEEPISTIERLYQVIYSVIAVLPKVIDGDFLYKDFAGPTLIPVLPINSIIVAICLILLIKKKLIDKNLLRLVFIIIVTHLITLFYVAGPQLRYFYIPVTFMGLIPPVCFGKIFAGEKGALKGLSIVMLSILLTVNMFYISVNHFYLYKKTKGGYFYVYNDKFRNPLIVLSHMHVDTRDLYKYLIEKGFERVITDHFTINNLLFWDIENNLIRCEREVYFKGNPNECLVFPEVEIPGKRTTPEEFGYEGLKEIGDVKNFKIYIYGNNSLTPLPNGERGASKPQGQIQRSRKPLKIPATTEKTL